MSITSIFGSIDSTGINKELKGQGSIAQEQYTPIMPEPSTVRQIQSVRVNPEMHLLSREDVDHVDEIISKYVDKVESYISDRKEELRTHKKREAKAYLSILTATLILSGAGFSIGRRLENNSISQLSIITLGITIYFILLKIPTLITIFY